jgi:hypothetical protein
MEKSKIINNVFADLDNIFEDEHKESWTEKRERQIKASKNVSITLSLKGIDNCYIGVSGNRLEGDERGLFLYVDDFIIIYLDRKRYSLIFENRRCTGVLTWLNYRVKIKEVK